MQKKFRKGRNAIFIQTNLIPSENNTKRFLKAVCEVEGNSKSPFGVDKSSVDLLKIFCVIGAELIPTSTSQKK